jgi:hypothetical protein
LKQSPVFRIDERVIYSMLAISALALIMLAFKFASGSKQLQISIAHDDSAFTNSQANFRVLGPTGKTYVWNFGDSSIESYTDTLAMHKYKKAGTYIITVTVDGQNKDIIKQDVYGVTEIPAQSPEIKISSQETALVNDVVTFSVNLPKDASIEWYFENSSQPSSTSNTVTKRFPTKGNKKIELKINPRTKGERIISAYINILEKEIATIANVDYTLQSNAPKAKNPIKVPASPTSPGLIPKENNTTSVPPTELPKTDIPKPVIKAAPFELSQEKLAEMLTQIKIDDLAKSAFQGFFCGDLDIPVTVGKETIKFGDLYKKIAGMKKHKAKNIQVVNITQNPETHCIRTFVVNL